MSLEQEIRKNIPIVYLNIWDDYPAPMYNRPYYEACDLLMGISKQTVNINNTTKGKISSIGIVTGGRDYNVNDRILFDNSATGGRNGAAKVERDYGKDIDEISVAKTSFSYLE